MELGFLAIRKYQCFNLRLIQDNFKCFVVTNKNKKYLLRKSETEVKNMKFKYIFYSITAFFLRKSSSNHHKNKILVCIINPTGNYYSGDKEIKYPGGK